MTEILENSRLEKKLKFWKSYGAVTTPPQVVEEMIEQGLRKFLFITGRKKRSIEDHFDDDPELSARLSDGERLIGEVDYAAAGVEFLYARQRRPSGNADAVRLAAEFVGDESFVVGFGDTIIRSPHHPGVVARMIESHERHGAAATVAGERRRRDLRYEVAALAVLDLRPGPRWLAGTLDERVARRCPHEEEESASPVAFHRPDASAARPRAAPRSGSSSHVDTGPPT